MLHVARSFIAMQLSGFLWLVTARDNACRVFDVRNQRIEMITFLREHNGFDMAGVSLITTRDEVIELDKMTTKQLKRCSRKIP